MPLVVIVVRNRLVVAALAALKEGVRTVERWAVVAGRA